MTELGLTPHAQNGVSSRISRSSTMKMRFRGSPSLVCRKSSTHRGHCLWLTPSRTDRFWEYWTSMQTAHSSMQRLRGTHYTMPRFSRTSSHQRVQETILCDSTFADRKLLRQAHTSE